MKSKHNKILQAIFADPVQANILWSDIESLLKAVGAEISEGSGSRVRIVLNSVRAVFHRLILEKRLIKARSSQCADF